MTASKPKTPSASGISRLLAAAGFERAILGPATGTRWDGRPDQRTRIWSPGFRVRIHDDHVRAFWRSGRVVNPDVTVAERKSWHDRYAEVIGAAGWHIEDRGECLIVTAKTED